MANPKEKQSVKLTSDYQPPQQVTMSIDPDRYEHMFIPTPVLPTDLSQLDTNCMLNEFLCPLVEEFISNYECFKTLPDDDISVSRHKDLLADFSYRIGSDITRILSHYVQDMAKYDSLALHLGLPHTQADVTDSLPDG
jgi:hypothetical protein